MSKQMLPISNPISFKGDIGKVEPDSQGFFYVKVTSPDNLNHPILQRRIKTVNGLLAIAGIGVSKPKLV